MAIANQPSNINYLSVVNFETNFGRMPNVSYFCNRVSIPGMALSSALQPNPFANVPIEGTHLDFEDLNMSFIVDEDMKNYLELYDWLTSIGFPEKFDQFTNDSGGDPLTVKSDINIIVHTNKSNPNYSIVFKDVFPVILGAVQFDTNATSIDPIVVDATFKYTGAFTINKLV